MTFQPLETVVLTRDLPVQGLLVGDLGAVVAAHGPDAFEVEFVRASGETQALVTLAHTELRPVGEYDLIAVRHCPPPPFSSD